MIYPGFRMTHARIHSAGHLLDVAMRRAGKKEMRPHKGYHFEKGSYVEYEGVVPAEERQKLIEELNKHCDDLISEAKFSGSEVFN